MKECKRALVLRVICSGVKIPRGMSSGEGLRERERNDGEVSVKDGVFRLGNKQQSKMSVCLNSAARETGLRKAGEPHVPFLCLSVWIKQKKSKDVGRWREGLGKLKGMTLAWDVRQYKFLKPGTPAPKSEKRGGEGRFNIVRQTHPQHRSLPGEGDGDRRD